MQKIELGQFAHQISDIGNIGAKLNIGEPVASVTTVCRYVIVTWWCAFSKPHSALSMSLVHMAASPQQAADGQTHYVIIIAVVKRSV